MFDISRFADTEDIGVDPEKPVKDTACAAFISTTVDEKHSMSFCAKRKPPIHRRMGSFATDVDHEFGKCLPSRR
jgi:hypothetical protein